MRDYLNMAGSGWRIANTRDALEFALVVDGLVTGLGYWLGPVKWRSSPALHYLNQMPGGMWAFGLFVTIAVGLIIVGRFSRWHDARRIGHALCAGLFFLFAVGVMYTYRPHGEATGGPGGVAHWLIIVWLHYRAGIARPPLSRRRRDGDI